MTELVHFLERLSTGIILPTLALVVVGIVVIRMTLKIVDRSLSKTRLERAAASLVRSLLKVVLYVLLALMAASKLGIDVSSVVALASVVSLAISLALQDALGNVIGGFTLLTTHPFKSGDYVEIGGQGGIVQTIDITYTTLTTPDNKTISIPNSTVVGSQIVNYATAGTRRVDITVNVAYGTEVSAVREALLNAAAVPTVLNEPAAPFVGLKNHGESTMQFVLQVWTGADDYWTTLFAVNERICEEFQSAGIQFSYPHVNVHIEP